MKRIAIIAGGDSSEYEVSLRSANAVCDSLDRSKFDPIVVLISKSGWQTLDGLVIDKNDFSYSLDCERFAFDFVVNVIHGTPGENGLVQGYFEMIGLPYSGCSVEASAVTFNKALTKSIVSSIKGVRMAKQIFLRDSKIDANYIVDCLGLPLFVKPNASGSSCGVTKVKSVEQLGDAVKEAFKESSAVLCEEFVDGVEVSQGVMILDDKEYVLPITELETKNEFFDYQAKYTAGFTNEITPARIDNDVANRVGDITLEVYKLLGCRDVVRVDYIIKGGQPYFIEVNTNPGMSNASIVPQQWREIGLTMGQAWELIIDSHFDK